MEEHAKFENDLLYAQDKMEPNRHILCKFLPKRHLTPMELSILNKIKLFTDVIQTPNGYSSSLGFPRVLIHIHDKQLYETTVKNNYQHYIAIQNLPPPLNNNLHTLNNTKVADIIDKIPNKTAAIKILGNYADTEKPIVYGNNKNTLFAATKRALKSAPIPDPQVSQEFIEFACKKINEDIGEYLKHFTYSYTQWYNHLPAKKQKLIEPIYLYYNQPETFNQLYTRAEQKKILDEAYTAICKAELQMIDGKPRMVCSIPQKYKYAMGPVTWKLEEICAKHLKGYCGNKNLSEMEEMINTYARQGFTKVVEGDGSAFDNTQDISLKAVDRYIYNQVAHSVYHLPKKEFLKISQSYYKKMQVKYMNNKKKLCNYITYYVLGTVFSGDCDTTLCNTIRMAMYNRFVNEKAGLKYGQDYVVFSKGDDFSVLYKPYIKDEFINQLYYKYFLKNDKTLLKDNRVFGIGQICKFLDIGGLNSFKFCSLRSWYKNLEGDVVLTRDPSKLYNLSKYSIKYKKYDHRQRMQYHHDLMTSYLINYPGIKIFKYMAAAHAKQFLSLLKQKEGMKNINKLIKSIQYKTIKNGESRIHLEQEYQLFPHAIMYDIQGVENFYKITGDYWETMKRMVNTHNKDFRLTDDELIYINNQINDEFDVEFILKDNDITNEDEVNNIINEVLTLKNTNEYKF